MFSADSRDDVLLGVPASTANDRVASCYNSKIGGSPLWISSDPPSDLTPTNCSHCKKHMIFTMQIYAPTDDLERALYMYCCPSSCATHSYGWKVLKDQRPKGSSNMNVKGGDKKCGDEKHHGQLSTATPTVGGGGVGGDPLKTDWLGLCAPPAPPSRNDNSTTTTTQGSGGWNLDDDASDDDDFTSLAALIEARDETLKVAKVKGNNSNTTDKSSGDGKSDNSTVSGRVNEPPPPPALVESSSVQSTPPPSCCIIEKETLLTEIYESECSATRSTPSNHIDNLLQKYIAETIAHGEEDPQVISLLQQQQSKLSAATKKKKQVDHDDSDDDFEDKDDEEFNNSIRQMQGARKALAIQQKNTNEEKQNHIKANSKKSNNSQNSNAMSKSDLAKKRKSEDYFQSRYAAAPSQVMRYAYGGMPMWCSVPPPPTDSSSVPLCSGCRAPRVFELQLMPALIRFVDEALPLPGGVSREGVTVSHSSTSVSDSADLCPPTSLLDLSCGFDFGVVSVWCCPNSCQGSVCEVAVVQTPSDHA